MPDSCVLVIDDDQAMLKMIQIALKRADLDVLLASSGSEGLQIFRDNKPDIAIVDIAMPEMDGYEVVTQIRASGEPHANLPIVILTAHAHPTMRENIEDLGISHFLVKPIYLADLTNLIAELVG